MTRPIAVLCADLHFSHKPPTARSAEPDWYVAMERAWNQISDYAVACNGPIIIAGDIFDRWNATPETINFVMDMFKSHNIFAVPGQHDLPHHNLDDIGKSAYGTLVKAGAIWDLSKQGQTWDGLVPIRMIGFPWGREIHPIEGREDDPDDKQIYLAVVHKYVWKKGHSFPGAPESSHVGAYRKELSGYDAAVFGDNHSSFMASSAHCRVLNCGTLMCRASDERNYQPHFGVLYDNATIEMVPLDTSDDKWIEEPEQVELEDIDVNNLVGELESLGGNSLDFAACVDEYIERHNIDGKLRQVLVGALENARGSTGK